MAKDVFDRVRHFVPVALVLAGWGCFIATFIFENPTAKLVFSAAARVLP
jgi:hypothetical protein